MCREQKSLRFVGGMKSNPVWIVTKTPHEYIRVTYKYIRVTYEYIQGTYEYIRDTYQ